MRYEIIGTTKVAGKDPGEIVTDDDLASANVHALIVGGHIAPATTSKPKAEEADDTESEAV